MKSLSISSELFGVCTWSIHWNENSPRVCGVLLKCIATSQVVLFVSIADLWLLNLILKSVLVDPTYCKWHFLQEAKLITFFESQESLEWMVYFLPFWRLRINLIQQRNCNKGRIYSYHIWSNHCCPSLTVLKRDGANNSLGKVLLIWGWIVEWTNAFWLCCPCQVNMD